jgi:hypothetical protein
MTNATFSYGDVEDSDVYCVFCDVNYKHKDAFIHCNSQLHMENRFAMLALRPRTGTLFCTDGDICPHLIEEDNDFWCGVGYESCYGKRGELRTGKEFGEDARKPWRPLSCTKAITGREGFGKNGSEILKIKHYKSVGQGQREEDENG